MLDQETDLQMEIRTNLADLKRQKLHNLYERKGIPPKYWDIDTDKTELLESCLSPVKKSVFVYGGAGTGKTVFACSLAKRIIADVVTGGGVISLKFVSSPELIVRLQDSFRDKSDRTAGEILTEISGLAVLILDDFGAEKMTEYVRQSLYYIINHREQYLLTTIITSNYNLQRLSDQIDDRIASRIAGMCEVLQFTGPDRRLKKQEE